jgi:hypothetical protein
MITLSAIILFLINLLCFALGVFLISWVFHLIVGWLGFAVPPQVIQILSAIFGLIVLLYFVQMVMSGTWLIRI